MKDELEVIFQKLDDFLASDKRNAWLETKHIKFYVRRSYRAYVEYPLNKMQRRNRVATQNCLDIPSVEFHPDFQGKGIFSKFVKRVREVSPYKWIMIENIGHEHLLKYVHKHGWIRDRSCLDETYYTTKEEVTDEKSAA